ncbi:MAG TPA: type II/IV secretion system protein [Candidatus Nealsonbacteria bacterium]|nr:type II/IV secretion system protein [Candidatus Nealsonbacteria bacterium]HEB46163.1 type II/IV secretion system protein [Candidatus Nealsonbacteria bacterium]
MTLVQQLLKQEVIDREKATSLEFEIKNSGRKEEEVILEKGVVDEKFLFNLKSENLKIPLREVRAEDVLLETLELIPEESIRYYKMIPLAKDNNVLEIGMVYPRDTVAQEALKFLARQNKFSYQISLIAPTTLDNLLKQYRTLKGEVTQALEELETELKGEKVKARPLKKSEMERLVEEAPVVKIVAVIVRHAVEGRASDIHIEPLRKKSRVRFRVDGLLKSSIFLPLRIHSAVIARIKILSNMKLDETRIPQDGRFSTRIGNHDIDFRVSTFPTILGEKVALRILDPEKGLKSVEGLGLTGRNLKITKEALQKPYGLILITGPTSSGKTTTLYAMLSRLNKEEVNILTLEDPVEYYLDGINQSQVRPELGFDFAKGLRHLVRQNPNILMVGEIRDPETANAAIHATLTGHIVLSTLHTTNALGVVPRLVDMGVEPFLIPAVLNIAMAQRLIRILCPDCKKKIVPKPEIKDLILKDIENLPSSTKKDVKIPNPLKIYTAEGCKKCNQQGFFGRTAIFEVLKMTDELAEIILKGTTEAKIKEEAFRQGMITMKQDGVLKVLQGITSIEEVIRAAEEIRIVEG